MAPSLSLVQTVWLSQRGGLFPWAPVCLACGIGVYFSLRAEPPIWALWACAAIAGLAFIGQWKLGELVQPIILGLGLVTAGLALAGARSHWVAGPVLDYRYYGPITGRVIAVDRSASGAMRLTLDHADLARHRGEVPRKLRVSLHGDQPIARFSPGDRVQLTGHLSPPGGAVEPGGFNFRRHAWFLQLGAVGYTRTPVLRLSSTGPPPRIATARQWLATRIWRALPGDDGAFAAAVITGDRSALSDPALNALRHSNIAHLLAISGLHMGLLVATVFGALRFGLIVVLTDRWPIKKLAAVCAFAVAFGYLLLSGGNIATERAFIMVGVMLGAILIDQRAVTLRAVAVAALIVLVLRPEALSGPGFQMSFAATTALVAVFQRLPMPKGLLGQGAALLASSFVAGAATAPVAMAHFNLMSHYGLLANLLTVPLMGAVVMPSALVAVALMPIGLEQVPLWVMGHAVHWILDVAHWVSGLPGAVGHVPSPPGAVLPMLALGAVFCILWQGRLRWLGIAPMAFSVALWLEADRPAVLIAEGGGLVGVQTLDGRALSRAKGSGFVAQVWLENDGQGLTQLEAAALWEGGQRIVRHVQGKRAAAGFQGCNAGQVVIASAQIAGDWPCWIFGPDQMAGLGAMRLDWVAGAPRLTGAEEVSGARLWSPRQTKP